METETFTATLDPRRPEVTNIVAEAWGSYDENNPAQLLADLVMATAICAEIMEADYNDIQPMFDNARGNAAKAAKAIMA